MKIIKLFKNILNKLRKPKQHDIVANWTFDNQFHMEFGHWEWKVPEGTKNKTIIKDAKERCGGATYVSKITKNGKTIYDIWERYL